MTNLDSWIAEPNNPYDKNIWYITKTEKEINLLIELDPFAKKYTKKEINKEEYIFEKELEFIGSDPIFTFAELYKSSLLEKIPIILITFDQLTNFENLPEELINELPNFNKVKKEMMYFNNHYATGMPCSPARSEIYTGQSSIKSTMSDNSDASWQYDIVTPSEGLDNLGSLLKKSDKKYYNRYIGKWHLSAKELSPNDSNSFNTSAQGNFLQKFGFDRFNDRGDDTYNKQGGIYTDSYNNELKLPIYHLDPDNLNEKNPSEGAIPFLEKRRYEIESKGECWSMCVNYTNPHDIAYIFSPNSNLNNAFSADNTPSGKTYPITGLDINSAQYKESLKLMNFNITSNDNFKILQTQWKSNDPPKSAIDNNAIYSVENTSGYSKCDISSMYAQSTCLYGIDSRNGDTYLDFIKQYRNLYFNLIKQIDAEFGILWDKIIEQKLHEKAVIMITSDHGDLIGDHGLIGKSMSFYKKSWNVPLFLSYPLMDKNLKNTTLSNYSVHRQILPTLLYFSNNKDLIPKYSNTPYNLILDKMATPLFDKNLIPINYDIVAFGFSSSYTSFGPMASIQTDQKLEINPLSSNLYQISSVNKYEYNNKNDEYSFSIELSLLTLLKSSLKNAYIIKKESLSDYLYWYTIIENNNTFVVSRTPIINSTKLTELSKEFIEKIPNLTEYVLVNSEKEEILLIQNKIGLIKSINLLFEINKNINELNYSINNRNMNQLSNFLNSIYKKEFIGIQTIQKQLDEPQKNPKVIGNFSNPVLDFNSFNELYYSNEFTFKLFNNTNDPTQNFNLLDPKRNTEYFDIAGLIFNGLKNSIIEQKLENLYFTGPFYSIADLIYKNYSTENSANYSIGNFNLDINNIITNFSFIPLSSNQKQLTLSEKYINLSNKITNAKKSFDNNSN